MAERRELDILLPSTRNFLISLQYDCKNASIMMLTPVLTPHGSLILRQTEEAPARFSLISGLVLQYQQQRQNLYGLAEPHVVGEAGPRA
jgi:hypothetical protein